MDDDTKLLVGFLLWYKQGCPGPPQASWRPATRSGSYKLQWLLQRGLELVGVPKEQARIDAAVAAIRIGWGEPERAPAQDPQRTAPVVQVPIVAITPKRITDKEYRQRRAAEKKEYERQLAAERAREARRCREIEKELERNEVDARLRRENDEQMRELRKEIRQHCRTGDFDPIHPAVSSIAAEHHLALSDETLGRFFERERSFWVNFLDDYSFRDARRYMRDIEALESHNMKMRHKGLNK